MTSQKTSRTQNKRKSAPKSASKTSAKRKTRRQKRGGFWKSFFKWSFVTSLWGLIALFMFIAWHARDLPRIADAPKFEREAGITVLARDGTTLARYGEMKGVSVTVRELPNRLIYAILAIEDRRFYSHYGIDPIGLTRAMLVNIREGAIVQGGSTITQQLAKNLFLSHERTIARKIREALLALWLEHKLSKDEILSAYLNRVYFGAGAYGVDAAAHTYFDKSARKLNLAESALLAGLLKAPARLSPVKNPKAARKRAKVVLGAMQDTGFIDKSGLRNANLARASEVDPPDAPGRDRLHHRYFTDWVVDNIDNYIGSTKASLVIKTTLHPELQNMAAGELRRSLRRHGKAHNIGQAAALVMRPDGAVLAMAGGDNYRRTRFNRTTQARRPPGSAFKPVVYLAALMDGYRPSDTIRDAPITAGDYRPENFSDNYAGTISLKTALADSKNTATVRLARKLGIDEIIATARTLGITADLPRDLSIALGSAGIPMIQMTSAYAMIANGGHNVQPHGITMIRRADGEILYKHRQTGQGQQIIDTTYTRKMRKMLRHAVEAGTAGNADLAVPAAGKTGTSQDYRDAWFVGFTSDYVGAVWMGNDDNSPMENVTGGMYPAKTWARIMTGAHEKHAWPDDAGPREEESAFTKILKALIAQ